MLTLFNSYTRKLEVFEPLDQNNIRMYVCGPTVYDKPHIGNARVLVIYDILFRHLRSIYGENHVTYVRNITDVDDKINNAAKERNISILELTNEIIEFFHSETKTLGCLTPNVEPRATTHMKEMHDIILKLIESNHAYFVDDHVYFDVLSDPNYAILAGRKLDELIPGARIEVNEHKRSPYDFVLWKPANKDDDPSSIFDSPWGRGRPGWHIECSAMSMKYLGQNFDIHGGGADLMFPHHSNEIAQSTCAYPQSNFAKYWVHNGFVTVNGEKMSKSLGNFITSFELLEKGVKGEVIRFALISSHYRKPLDLHDRTFDDAKKTLDSFYRALLKAEVMIEVKTDPELIDALNDDLNTSLAISILHRLTSEINKETNQAMIDHLASRLKQNANYMGFLFEEPNIWFGKNEEDTEISDLVNARLEAKKAKDFALADKLRMQVQEKGYVIEDKPDGTSIFYKR